MVEAAAILIADDEEIFRETTADLLRSRGYRCDSATSAPTAMEALDRGPFDLLIADIRMPGNSGLQLVEQLQMSRPGLPVILVTGAPSLDSAIHSVQLPVAAYLTKPLDLEVFYRHVDRCVAESTTRHILRDASQALSACAEELERLEEEVLKGSLPPTDSGIAEAADSAIRTMLDTLRSLEPLWQRYGSREDSSAVRSLAESPRERAMQEAIEYAVLVLERTRNSFKSKELGELRSRLRRLLRNPPV